MRKLLNRMAILLALALVLMSVPGFALAETVEPEENAAFEQWKPDAPALNALIK